MIKGKHCVMCNANIICEEIKPSNDYCEEVQAAYQGKAAADDVTGLLEYVKSRMKNIEHLYHIPYFILIHSFKQLIELEVDSLIKMGGNEDVKNNN